MDMILVSCRRFDAAMDVKNVSEMLHKASERESIR